MKDMTEIRRKVVGDCLIITEEITRRSESKNVLTERVIRRSKKGIVLDCGHKVPRSRFTKVPTNNTRCYECEGYGARE